MSATPSTMMPLGTLAPSFNLPDTVSGNSYALSDLKGEKATIVLFIWRSCICNGKTIRAQEETGKNSTYPIGKITKSNQILWIERSVSLLRDTRKMWNYWKLVIIIMKTANLYLFVSLSLSLHLSLYIIYIYIHILYMCYSFIYCSPHHPRQKLIFFFETRFQTLNVKILLIF